jgi:hypothetical protein|tara:strand:+ start:1847 stop:2074 length:228 start_codon:yes stop_codon:yes gene_type:complete
MEWTKEKLIKTLKYIIQSSESKEEAFEKTDYLFYEHLTRDDLVDIIINLLEAEYELNEDYTKEFNLGKPDLKIVH